MSASSRDVSIGFSFRAATIVPLNNLATRFFWGGGLVVVISGAARWISEAGVESLVKVGRPSLGGIILNVLVYFMLGLVLLSQAQLTMLLTRWEIQQVNVSSGLVKRWVRHGLITLVLVTTAVFFLPTGYSLGLLDSVRLAFQFFMSFVVGLLQLILFILSLPFFLLALLFPSSATRMRGRPPQPWAAQR